MLVNGSTEAPGPTEPPGTVEPPTDSPASEWIEMSLPQSGTIKGIWGSSATDVFAVGEQGTLLHSDGPSWRSMNWAPGGDWGREHYHFDDVWGTSGSNVFAVGDGPCIAEGSLYSTAHVILHYNGLAWNRLRLPDGGNAPGSYGSPDGCARSPYNQLHAIWGRGPNEIYAMGSPDYFLRYDGAQWRPIEYSRFNLTDRPEGDDSAQMPEVRDIIGFSDGTIYAVGRVFYAGGWHKGMVRSGGSWRPFATPSELEVIHGIWGTAADDLYAVGYPTGSLEVLLHFDGWSWSAVSEFDFCSGYDLYGLIGTGPSNLYTVGGGCVLHYDGTQVTLLKGPGDEGGFPANLYDIWRAPDGTIFAAGDRVFQLEGPLR